MENNQEKMNKILSNFLKSESNVTDDRILSIRRFLSVLQEATDRYVETSHHSELERKELARLLENMSEIYRQEVSQLLVKRGKLAEFISVLQPQPNNKEQKVVNTSIDNIYLN